MSIKQEMIEKLYLQKSEGDEELTNNRKKLIRNKIKYISQLISAR